MTFDTEATPLSGTVDANVIALRGGEHVGRYVILYTLGTGGMGVVYAAYDPQLDRKVAIKLMRTRAGRTARQSTLLHEAQALARLSDPHVVAIHDVGIVGDRVFVAMDFVEGQTLRRWAQSSPRKPADIVAAYRQAALGLAAAHRAGLVHSDFKPDNALVDANGRVQVLDFGLARAGEIGNTPNGDEPAPAPRKGRGTPMYMAPEQHRGEPARPASDQFAFCVSLFEALWHRLPFPGDDNAAIAKAVLHGPSPDPPRGRGIGMRLRRAVLRGLQRDPEARHRSMEQLDDALRHATTTGRRRRRAAVAAALVAVAGGAWAIGRALAPTPEPCAGAEDRLADTWTPERATAIAGAFAATRRAHAPQTAIRLVGTLDAFAAAWTSQWRDACEATHVHREQSTELLDLRMSCLDGRRQRLAALVHLLADADGDIVDNAVEAALSLPDLQACADAGALRLRAALPTDERARLQIDDVRIRIAHASALDDAGKATDAAALAELASDRANELAYPPLIAEASLLLGHVLDIAGNAERAETVLRTAALAAEEAGDAHLLADARIALVAVAGGRLGKVEQAQIWGELAAAALGRITRDPRRESRLAHNLALVLEHLGKPEDVLEHQRRALALASEPGATDEIERAPLYSDLAMTLSDLGEHDEALARANAGLAIWRAAYGDDHPRTAAALGAVGVVYDRHGDMTSAQTWYRESHAAFTRALGADNPRTADMLTNVAIASIELGEIERGINEFEQTLAIHESKLGERNPTLAQDHQNLGSALRLAGRTGEALAHHQRALEMREALFGRDDPRVAASLVGVANVLEEDRKLPVEALALRQRALAIGARTLGPDHPQLCLEIANLAHNLLAVGDAVDARETAMRAHRIAADPAVSLDIRTYAALVLARVLVENPADRDRARTLLEAARRDLDHDVDGAERLLVVAIEAKLAG